MPHFFSIFVGGLKEVSDEARLVWEKLSPTERTPYEKLAKADKEKDTSSVLASSNSAAKSCNKDELSEASSMSGATSKVSSLRKSSAQNLKQSSRRPTREFVSIQMSGETVTMPVIDIWARPMGPNEAIAYIDEKTKKPNYSANRGNPRGPPTVESHTRGLGMYTAHAMSADEALAFIDQKFPNL